MLESTSKFSRFLKEKIVPLFSKFKHFSKKCFVFIKTKSIVIFKKCLNFAKKCFIAIKTKSIPIIKKCLAFLRPKFKRFLRKRAIGLKRNFYKVPFIFICICCVFYLGILFILIKSVGRIDYQPTSIFLFVGVLTSVLSIVAILGYTQKVYGQKRSIKMLVIYYVITAICIGFTIAVFIYNDKQIAQEIMKRDSLPPPIEDRAEYYIYQTYINYGNCSRGLLITFFIFEAIANGLLIAAPFIDKKLKSISFDSIKSSDNEKQ